MSKGIVTKIYICSRCSEAMSANSKPSVCLKCGFKMSKKESGKLTQKFESGKSVYDQMYELVQQDMDKFIDKSLNELLPSMSKEKAESIVISNKTRYGIIKKKRLRELNTFLETVPLVELQPWLESTLHFYKILMNRSDKETILVSCSFGEQIGEISKNVKHLMDLGVQLHEGTNKQTPKGNNKNDHANDGGKKY